MTDHRTTEPDTRPSSSVVLTIEGLRKEFNGLVALDDADIEVYDGEIVSLVGPNGAGKSTLFNCVMGNLDATAGQVWLADENITNLKTNDIVTRGLSRTFQIPRVFPGLSVRENMVANQNHLDEAFFSTLYKETDDATGDRIDELLEFVGLSSMAEESAGNLSTGQQKLLNIASTLLPDPDVIMLDEPTAGVNPALIDDITDMILELNDQGRTFLVIEHDMDVVRKISDYTYVLANGTNLTDGHPEAALAEPEVLEAYFGE